MNSEQEGKAEETCAAGHVFLLKQFIRCRTKVKTNMYFCKAQPKPLLSCAEWLCIQLLKPQPPTPSHPTTQKVYFATFIYSSILSAQDSSNSDAIKGNVSLSLPQLCQHRVVDNDKVPLMLLGNHFLS